MFFLLITNMFGCFEKKPETTNQPESSQITEPEDTTSQPEPVDDFPQPTEPEPIDEETPEDDHDDVTMASASPLSDRDKGDDDAEDASKLAD